MPIFLPALRERTEDIPYLVSTFIQKFNRLHGRDITGIEAEAIDALRAYDWPGNIRELENAVERAFVMELGNRISLRSLPEQISGISPEEAFREPRMPGGLEEGQEAYGRDTAGEPNVAGIDFQLEKEEFERLFIINALKRFGGRINQTVAHANIPKNTLLRKIRKYDIKAQEYGADESRLAGEDLVPDETL
jgi:DNA-binding NtrC family response regulator